MFTFNDIKNIAIQIERNGEESYRIAAAKTKDAEVAEMLLWMAEQEASHANWFAGLESCKPISKEQQEIEAIGKSLLQDMVKGNSFLLDQEDLNQAASAQAVIDLSVVFERETILFYEFLRGFIEDIETISQLDTIIAEEEAHITNLEQLRESLEAAVDQS